MGNTSLKISKKIHLILNILKNIILRAKIRNIPSQRIADNDFKENKMLIISKIPCVKTNFRLFLYACVLNEQ